MAAGESGQRGDRHLARAGIQGEGRSWGVGIRVLVKTEEGLDFPEHVEWGWALPTGCKGKRDPKVLWDVGTRVLHTHSFLP